MLFVGGACWRWLLFEVVGGRTSLVVAFKKTFQCATVGLLDLRPMMSECQVL